MTLTERRKLFANNIPFGCNSRRSFKYMDNIFPENITEEEYWNSLTLEE